MLILLGIDLFGACALTLNKVNKSNPETNNFLIKQVKLGNINLTNSNQTDYNSILHFGENNKINLSSEKVFDFNRPSGTATDFFILCAEVCFVAVSFKREFEQGTSYFSPLVGNKHIAIWGETYTFRLKEQTFI